MIDLHVHTSASDGSCSPEQLVEESQRLGLEAVGIADHDTLDGFIAAQPHALRLGVDLVCGIEISTRHLRKGRPAVPHVHLLGYFLDGPAREGFHRWLGEIRADRNRRNKEMAEKLRSAGLDVTVEEVEALGGNITGRPHFARLLVQKGYVSSLGEAFRRYIGDDAPAYVPRRAPSTAEAIERVRAGGGLAVLAHPARLVKKDFGLLEEILDELSAHGLAGIEAFHSEHSVQEQDLLLGIAQSRGLLVSGGSDFHGDRKVDVSLGTGISGNLNIPLQVLENLRQAARRTAPPSL